MLGCLEMEEGRGSRLCNRIAAACQIDYAAPTHTDVDSQAWSG